METNGSMSCPLTASVRALNVPKINSIEINGGNRTFTNFSLESNATATTLKEIKVSNTKGVPLTIDSDKLTLHKVFISGNTTSLVLKKDGVVLELSQDSAIQSTSQYAVIAKNPVIQSLSSADGAMGYLRVVGNFGYVNSIQGEDYIAFTNGELKKMTDEEFEKFIKGSFNVAFDANGGETDTTSITAYCGSPLGTLPVPRRDYYNFTGWYTDPELEEEDMLVDENTVFSTLEEVTLYAHWIEKELSDWVLESELPEDAQVVNTKYSFTHRYYAENSSASKDGDGWTLYDTKRTSWGATQGPVYSNPSNGSRYVWSESYVSSYKTMYHYYRYASVNRDYGGDSAASPYGDCIYYREISLDYELSYLGTLGANYSNPNGNWWWKCGNYTTSEPASYGTRWYYQEPVYTYYFYQDVEEEADSCPDGDEYTNIQTWIQYRAK